MARCSSCSAPLAANTNICPYCNTRNDVDLHSKYDFKGSATTSERMCPHCDIPMQTINLGIDGDFFIERCEQCYGLFFDPGELETMMEHAVSSVFMVNRDLLSNITNERYQKDKAIKYVKCPECQKFMHRQNFGHRSGVVIDRCHSHGVWLDSGEITHLLEWKKAGGEILHEKKVQNEKSVQQQKAPPPPPLSSTKGQNRDYYGYDTPSIDLVDAISSLVGKLFR